MRRILLVACVLATLPRLATAQATLEPGDSVRIVDAAGGRVAEGVFTGIVRDTLLIQAPSELRMPMSSFGDSGQTLWVRTGTKAAAGAVAGGLIPLGPGFLIGYCFNLDPGGCPGDFGEGLKTAVLFGLVGSLIGSALGSRSSVFEAVDTGSLREGVDFSLAPDFSQSGTPALAIAVRWAPTR